MVSTVARRAAARHWLGWSGPSGAVAAGLVADRWIGEPPIEPHPVAVFGRLMTVVERLGWRDRRMAGLVYWMVGVGGAILSGRLLAGAHRGSHGSSPGSSHHGSHGAGWPPRAARLRPWVGAAVATWVTVAGRGLAEAANEVGRPLMAGDLVAARRLLPALVGRDPDHLGENEIARAVVESVAENTVDAVVAPALWAAVGGAAGALGYRAVNTLDSMVGHHSPRYERFGWASARFDDAANWVPARVCAVLVAAVRPGKAAAVVRAVRQDAPGHPSPNAGVAEAAFAAALDIHLGGTNTYGERTEIRPRLGCGRASVVSDIERAVDLAQDVADALTLSMAVGPLLWLAVVRANRDHR